MPALFQVFFNALKYKSNPKTSKMIAPQKPPGGDQVVEFFGLNHLYITNSPRWVAIAPPWPAFVSSSLWFRRGAVAAWARRHPSHAWGVRSRRSKMSWRRNGEKPTGWPWAEVQQENKPQGAPGDGNICWAISVCSCGDFAPNQPNKSGIVVTTNQLSLTYPYLEHHHRVLHVLLIKLWWHDLGPHKGS